MSQPESAEHIIDNILTFSQTHGDLLNKYSLSFYLNHFDRNRLLLLSQTLQTHRPLTEEDFTRLLLLNIPHQEHQTLYLALSLHQLFRAVLQRTNTTMTIDFSDFTTYLCEKISKDDLDIVLAPRQVVEELPSQEELQEIRIKPPIIATRAQQSVPKMNKELTRKNKKLEEKKSVSKMFYSWQHRQIIAVGTLASAIRLYDCKLNQTAEVRPKQCRELDKEVGILSMAYSHQQHRIGAILTSGNLVFWEGSDNFETEKSIPIKHYGDKIFYLEQKNQWITVNSTTVHFWNLKDETVVEGISCKQAATIMDICEINHLRSVCLSIVGKNQEKFLAVYQGEKRKAVINLGTAACHTLHYNKIARCIVPLSYTNSLQVYSIEGNQFDPQLKYTLRGHKSIITCVDSLPQQTLMITGDDAGQIRVWQLTYMRCLQSLKLTRWLGNIKFIDDQLLYSDSRINLLRLQHFVETKKAKDKDKEVPIYQSYDPRDKALWIFTKKDVRKVSITSGRITDIYVLCGEEEQISAAVCIGDGFVVGQSNGRMLKYNSDANLIWQRQAHEGEIKTLTYDSKNRLIFSLGAEGRVVAWPERDMPTEEERKIITFRKKALNFLKISQKSTMMVVGHFQQKELIFWDYEVLTLLQVLEMDHPVTAVSLSSTVDLLMVATSDNRIFLIKFTKKEHGIELLLLSCIETAQLVKLAPCATLGEQESLNGLLLCSFEDWTRHSLIVSTSKGQLFSYDLTAIIFKHFVLTEQLSSRESVNILRNQKQQFQTSLNQRGHHQFSISLPSLGQNSPPLLWIARASKQNLTNLCSFQLKQTVIGVLCQEYSKMVDISEGQIVTSLHISQPLPIKWTEVTDRTSQLKKELYQTLKVLDSILKNNGYEMLARQYKMVNVTDFMDKMRSCCFFRPKKDALPPLTCPHPLTPSHLSQEEPTLKTLEAYKRVKAIKKSSEESMEMPPILPLQQMQLQRDNIMQMLSSDNYGDLIQRYNLQKDSFSKNLSAKLSDSLIRHNSKGLKTIKAQQSNESRRKGQVLTNVKDAMIKQLACMTKSMRVEKDLGEIWLQKSERKDIREILGDLNNKLKKCRLRKSKDPQMWGQSRKATENF